MQKTIKEATEVELLKAKVDLMNQLFALNGQLNAIDAELNSHTPKPEQPTENKDWMGDDPILNPEKPLETE